MPYASDCEMIAAVRTEGLLEVTTAATERDRCHPLMGCEVGGAYDKFRAVQDLSDTSAGASALTATESSPPG
jgi:hypothetical protein